MRHEAELPPHNLEAESALLGSMLLDRNAVAKVVGKVVPADFYSAGHRDISRAIFSLFDQGKPCDLVTVCDHIRALGLEGPGLGSAYVSSLLLAVPTAANVEEYAGIVSGLAVRRRLLELAARTRSMAFDLEDDPEDVIGRIESDLLSIRRRDSGGLMHISGPLRAYIESLERRKAGETSGIPSGLADLDAIIDGLRLGELSIVAARPSMGKSSFCYHLALSAGKVGYGVAIFSLESSMQQIAERIVSSSAGLEGATLRKGFFGEGTLAKVVGASAELSRMNLYIDDRTDITASEIRARSRLLAEKLRGEGSKLGLVIVDYVQLVRPTSRRDRRDLELGEVTQSLKALAKELPASVILVSQLNRGVESRDDKRPKLSDLRESGELEQAADVVMLLYREDYYRKGDSSYTPSNSVEILVSKQRTGPAGSGTGITAYFDLATGRIGSMSKRS